MPLFGPEEQNVEAMEPSRKPAAHFFKACRLYNGCIRNDKKEYHREKGVQSVSPLSAAQVSMEAVAEVHPNKVPIRINGTHAPATPRTREERESLDNDRSEPPLVFEAGTPHVKVDLNYDLLCFSSFESAWNRDEAFSGANACRQKSPAARARRMGLGLPPLTRNGYVVNCKDCKKIVNELGQCLAWTTHAPHYYGLCVGQWVTFFRNVEQVFLIVPGLTKAKPGDNIKVYRFGGKELVKDILNATKYCREDEHWHFPTEFDEDLANGKSLDTKLVGVETTEVFGSDGPSRCFEGNGIKLHEACASESGTGSSDSYAHKPFLEVLFRGFCRSRHGLGEPGQSTSEYDSDLGDFPPYPPREETTRIASGVIEFRVLTYELQEGDK